MEVPHRWVKCKLLVMVAVVYHCVCYSAKSAASTVCNTMSTPLEFCQAVLHHVCVRSSAGSNRSITTGCITASGRSTYTVQARGGTGAVTTEAVVAGPGPLATWKCSRCIIVFNEAPSRHCHFSTDPTHPVDPTCCLLNTGTALLPIHGSLQALRSDE